MKAIGCFDDMSRRMSRSRLFQRHCEASPWDESPKPSSIVRRPSSVFRLLFSILFIFLALLICVTIAIHTEMEER
jgi:hypothetical protein